ncbi:bifunctional metallophosphatase/5'-nucleotidase [Methanospirillum lacunae]|nr:bifunctional metallophosphatase/5'-nucleotidase [Methanospirillum lacunae]
MQILFLSLLIASELSLAETPAPDQSHALQAESSVNITILAINDFHGQITSGKQVNNTPVGGLGSLASYLTGIIHNAGPNHTIIALPGDLTGASTPESGLLLDEPSLIFYNLFSGNISKDQPYYPITSCPVIATVGNHEFDHSVSELLRKINGGNGNTSIPHLQDPYPGSEAKFISSNIYYNNSSLNSYNPENLLLTPYTVKIVDSVPVAFIGATTISTPSIVSHDNVKDLVFRDEADAINEQVKILQNQGIHAFVVLLHEGGSQDPYDGQTRDNVNVTGRVVDIVSHLDGDVDIVLSAHTHNFTNVYLNNSENKSVLVTQAYSYSKGFANVSFSVNTSDDEIEWKSASIVIPYTNQYPGTQPNQEASFLLNDTLNLTNPLLNTVISYTDMNINTARDENGESNMYDLVTDSMRNAMKTDIGLLNEGAVRADIYPGNITEEKMYELLPFGNNIIAVNMTGDQIRLVLEEQWNRTVATDHNIQISGFSYTYNETKPVNNKIQSLSFNGSVMDPDKEYSVATINYLASGGDGYSMMTQAIPGVTGPLDVDVLTSYIKELLVPLSIVQDGRIMRV